MLAHAPHSLSHHQEDHGRREDQFTLLPWDLPFFCLTSKPQLIPATTCLLSLFLSLSFYSAYWDRLMYTVDGPACPSTICFCGVLPFTLPAHTRPTRLLLRAPLCTLPRTTARTALAYARSAAASFASLPRPPSSCRLAFRSPPPHHLLLTVLKTLYPTRFTYTFSHTPAHSRWVLHHTNRSVLSGTTDSFYCCLPSHGMPTAPSCLHARPCPCQHLLLPACAFGYCCLPPACWVLLGFWTETGDWITAPPTFYLYLPPLFAAPAMLFTFYTVYPSLLWFLPLYFCGLTRWMGPIVHHCLLMQDAVVLLPVTLPAMYALLLVPFLPCYSYLLDCLLFHNMAYHAWLPAFLERLPAMPGSSRLCQGPTPAYHQELWTLLRVPPPDYADSALPVVGAMWVEPARMPSTGAWTTPDTCPPTCASRHHLELLPTCRLPVLGASLLPAALIRAAPRLPASFQEPGLGGVYPTH